MKSEPASTKRDEGQKNPKSWAGAGECYFQGSQKEQVRLEVSFPWTETFVIVQLSLERVSGMARYPQCSLSSPFIRTPAEALYPLPSLIPGTGLAWSCSCVRAHPVGSLCLPPIFCLLLRVKFNEFT